MEYSVSECFSDYAKDRAGKHLRGIVSYDQDGFELEYLRADVEKQHSENEIEMTVSELWWDAFTDRWEEESILGQLNCTVRCFDEAILMNFIHEDYSGIIVSLDADAPLTLYTLIGEFLKGVSDTRKESN